MTLKSGDMVMIVRCCCGGTEYGLGKPFVVSHVIQVTRLKCSECLKLDPTDNGLFAVFKDPQLTPKGIIRTAPVPWLIRIDPPADALASERAVARPRKEVCDA